MPFSKARTSVVSRRACSHLPSAPGSRSSPICWPGARSTASALKRRSSGADGAERKLSLSELLGLAQAPAAPPPPSQEPSSSRLWAEDVDLLDHLAAAVSLPNVLTEWEIEFAIRVSRRYLRATQLTDRQRAVAEQIVVKAKRAALGMQSNVA